MRGENVKLLKRICTVLFVVCFFLLFALGVNNKWHSCILTGNSVIQKFIGKSTAKIHFSHYLSSTLPTKENSTKTKGYKSDKKTQEKNNTQKLSESRGENYAKSFWSHIGGARKNWSGKCMIYIESRGRCELTKIKKKTNGRRRRIKRNGKYTFRTES